MGQERLAEWLVRVLREPVTITRIERLGGGAIQENWLLSVRRSGGRVDDFVLRRDARAAIGSSASRALEFRILRAVHQAGVAVARPVALCETDEVFERPFFMMERVAGVADPRRLVRDDILVPDRRGLGQALGAELARIHALAPETSGFEFLGAADPDPPAARVAYLRHALDGLPDPEPAIEWVLRELERRRPHALRVTLVHGDYRIGNIMVANGRVAAVLDWEFTGWGDPDEDLAWLCAPCWRFGRADREAGGVASREDFYAGYEARSGRAIDPARIHYWEIMATIRWAIVALEQGERHRTEERPGLEAALTGRMAPALVAEAMTMLREASDA